LVAGKTEPERIFELLGRKGEVVAASNPKASQPSRLHESPCQTMATGLIGWRWYREATSPVISDLPLVRAVAGELAAAALSSLR
jgi:hypothetical protein